jgi:hypothetical protein
VDGVFVCAAVPFARKDAVGVACARRGYPCPWLLPRGRLWVVVSVAFLHACGDEMGRAISQEGRLEDVPQMFRGGEQSSGVGVGGDGTG